MNTNEIISYDLSMSPNLEQIQRIFEKAFVNMCPGFWVHIISKWIWGFFYACLSDNWLRPGEILPAFFHARKEKDSADTEAVSAFHQRSVTS